MVHHPNTSLDDVCALIGFSATMRLLTWHAGKHVYVPEEPSEDHHLAKLLGVSALRALSREFGSQMIWVPKDSAGKHRRGVETKKQVAKLLNKGHFVEQIAVELGLSTRQVHRAALDLLDLGLIDAIPVAQPIEVEA